MEDIKVSIVVIGGLPTGVHRLANAHSRRNGIIDLAPKVYQRCSESSINFMKFDHVPYRSKNL